MPTQQELDELMVEAGAVRYWKRLEGSPYSSTSQGRTITNQLLESFTLLLSQYRKPRGHESPYYRLVHGVLEPDVVAEVALRTFLDGLVSFRSDHRNIEVGARFSGTATKIGVSLQHEAVLRKIREGFKNEYDSLSRRSKTWSAHFKKNRWREEALRYVPECVWSRDEIHSIGGFLVASLIERFPNYFELEVRPTGPKKKVRFIVPSQELLEWVHASTESRQLLTPLYMPSVEPLLPYETMYDGGYSSNYVYRNPLVISQYPQKFEEHINTRSCPKVLKAVNSLQQVGYRVNPTVLQCLQEVGLGSMDPYETVSDRPDDEEELIQWKREKYKVKKRNNARTTKGLLLHRMVEMAQRLQDEERFFYPYRIDYRGRMYPVVFGLSPQGPDFGRGLLDFARGHPIDTVEAREWLLIHAANCMGVDKVPFSERVEWAEDHRSSFERLHKDPLNAVDFWGQADDPYQFLQVALEVGAMFRGQLEVSHSPVAMDGSCNGLQCYSLLLGDPVGGLATNCMASDRPQDIYREVADALHRRLPELGDGPADLAIRHLFRDGVPRSLVKRAVMTTPYSVTFDTMKAYVIEEIEKYVIDGKVSFEGPKQQYGVCKALTGLLKHAIEEKVEGAMKAMKWLREVAGQVLSVQSDLTWVTPSGFPLIQEYLKKETKLVKYTVNGKAHRSTVYHPIQGNPDRRKARLGIAPNFIHSLDAAAMALTVVRCRAQGIYSLSMIHDSFATTAHHAAKLARSLRRSYAEVFRAPLLEDFKASLEHQTGLTLPDPPERGPMSPNVVLDSPYFFA